MDGPYGELLWVQFLQFLRPGSLLGDALRPGIVCCHIMWWTASHSMVQKCLPLVHSALPWAHSGGGSADKHVDSFLPLFARSTGYNTWGL